MNKINYVTGDATEPQGDGIKCIVHVCNDIGAWGAGFVLALSAKWDKPEKAYRAMSEEDRILGLVHLIGIDDDTIVANMIGQHGVGRDEQGYAPIRYSALVHGLTSINNALIAHGEYMKRPVSIHMPRIGSDRAGGNWEFIERIIEECTTVPVTVYDLP